MTDLGRAQKRGRPPSLPPLSLDRAPSQALLRAGTSLVFDHVAVAARRIRDLLSIYHELLGGRLLFGGDDSTFQYRYLQLSYPGGRVELMEPLLGSRFFDKFFAHKGDGLHHVTFRVEDITRAMEALGAAGIHITAPHLDDPSRREIFIHPREAFGTLIQLVQESPDEPQSAMTIDDILAGNGWGGTGIPSP